MQKLYYSISEVSQLVDEEQHILRYWEKEFEQLKPKKNRGGNRIYSDKDLKIIKAIKTLIREEKLSLKGAIDKLDLLLKKIDKEEKHYPGMTSMFAIPRRRNINPESKKMISVSAVDMINIRNTLAEAVNKLLK